MNFIVQASSRSWAGDKEHCMYLLDGYPAIYWTIKRIYENFNSSKIIIIAPEYDRNGELNNLKDFFNDLEIFYGFNESPLRRIIEVTNSFDDEEFFVRINGLNFLFEINYLKNMVILAKEKLLDCIKLNDDFPVHYTCEVYKISALRKLHNLIQNNQIKNYQIHEIHPKFILMQLEIFKTEYYLPSYEIDSINNQLYREKMKQIMFEERQNVENINQMKLGDQLNYHYELAKEFLVSKNIRHGKILDIACGTAKGLQFFLDTELELYGADYDLLLINNNKKQFTETSIIFMKEDIMKTSFKNNMFDIILSMETLEHVNPNKMLFELQRIIKNNGYLILSTPQNSYDGECINPEHLYEYSLKEVINLVSKYFTIEKIVGLKAGRIYFENDLIGANTMIFAKKNIV
ncbi:class I SAM-dependent methyltransferase [Aliarcobacter butzleri]|uniref:class I SAM-dependent methyltransferase n=1 Tax=Aliarcobacter butzleri TaxID=28197 RepID=UPI0021B1E28A|nr:class I SAM-dependent methyltransferase [Aliarcobacter butzleri]MCT7577798.1 class I SAM-dependent methyltransferase [Aliarcobacter butzleri]